MNDEQKKYFTAVLRGMLNLGNAKFRYGCTGVNLDYLARGPLGKWDRILIMEQDMELVIF